MVRKLSPMQRIVIFFFFFLSCLGVNLRRFTDFHYKMYWASKSLNCPCSLMRDGTYGLMALPHWSHVPGGYPATGSTCVGMCRNALWLFNNDNK